MSLKICLYLHCMQVMGWAALHTIQSFMVTRPTWGCWRFIWMSAVLKQGCRESRVLRETVGWVSIPTWNPPRGVLMPSPGQKMPKPMEVQFSSVPQSCPTLCSPMDCSMPGFPVLHQLSEPAQIHVHWVSDVVQPCHPLSAPSAAFTLSQHQGLFQWVSSSHQVAKVLEL